MTAIYILCVQQLIKVPSRSRRERKWSCSTPEGRHPVSTSRELEQEWLFHPLPLSASHWELGWVTYIAPLHHLTWESFPWPHCLSKIYALRLLSNPKLKPASLMFQYIRVSSLGAHSILWGRTGGSMHDIDSVCLLCWFRLSDKASHSNSCYSLHNRHHRQLFPN